MQIKHICALILFSIKGEVGTVKPVLALQKFSYCGVLWIFFCYMCFSLLYCDVCFLRPCGELFGGG